MSEEIKQATPEKEGVPSLPAAISAEELIRRKERKKQSDAKSYRKRTDKKKASSYAWNSTVEIKPKEARLILQEERNIRNPRVLDVCVELAQLASRNLKIPFNASLFKKGLQGTLAAARGDEPQRSEEHTSELQS